MVEENRVVFTVHFTGIKLHTLQETLEKIQGCSFGVDYLFCSFTVVCCYFILLFLTCDLHL